MNPGVIFGISIMISSLMYFIKAGPFWVKLIPIGIGFVVAVVVAMKNRDGSAVEYGIGRVRLRERMEDIISNSILKKTAYACFILLLIGVVAYPVYIYFLKKDIPEMSAEERMADIEAKLKMDQEVAAKEEASILHGSGVMRVSYNMHDPIEGGSKRIASLPPGKWRMNISGVHKQYYSDVGYVDIPPEGRVGLRLKFQKDFPVPEASPGARVVKIGTDPWKYAGEEIEFETFAEKTDVWVTINQRQSNPDNFLQNKGGDKIKIKRVGQMSAALFCKKIF